MDSIPFIELHLVDNAPIWLNVNHVVSFYRVLGTIHGEQMTRIGLSGGLNYEVHEGIGRIKELISSCSPFVNEA